MSRFTIELTPALDDLLAELCEEYERERLNMLRVLVKSAHASMIKAKSDGQHTSRQENDREKTTRLQITGKDMVTGRQAAGKEMSLVDAHAGAGALVFSSPFSPVPPSLPDPESPDPGPEAEPKPMPLWTASVKAPESWPFIALGIANWPKGGAMAGFDELELARLLYAAWSANPDCDPIDVVGETEAQIEAWLEGKRGRVKRGTLKTNIHRRLRQDAANAKERTAKQQKRIDAHGRELDAQEKAANDDPLTEWEAAPWKKDKA